MNLFEFYVDGDKFYDLRINELALIDPVLELVVNNAGTLTFTIPPTHPKYDSFKPLTSTIEIFRDGEWFWEGRIIDEKRDFYNRKTYTIEGALGYLNDSIQPQAEYHDINPIGYVERLLNVHNSMVAENRKIYLGAVTVVDPNNSLFRYTNFNCTLQELKEDIIDDLGGYCRLRKRDGKLYLDVLEEYDRTCTQVIRIGDNLIDLAPGFDYSEIKSVIIPLGARLEDQEQHEDGLENLDKYVEITDVNDGKNYIARADLVEEFDKIWQKVEFQDVHIPDNLLKKAEEYLKDSQWGEMVIEAKAFDLNYTDEEFQEFQLGDRVRVKSDIHGIDRYFPITAQTINFTNISENTITLGGTGEPVSITGITNDVSISTDKLDERIKDPNRLIQQAIYQATELINQGLNGFVRVDGNEILIMDTDDPETATKVWRWNMGGLGYSNNGYNGPFETAITMDGTIAGNFLAAGTVAAEQIDVHYTSQVEKDCNDYTDGKLKDYYTQEQIDVQFQTNSDSILESVSKTYATQDDMGDLEVRIQSTEQKVTEEGIFTNINNGIKGSEYITNTKFSMTKDGLTIQGGGITIKNNAGTNVFYADTYGDITMRGNFIHYASTGYRAIEIIGHEMNFYAWYTSGNYVGSIGATRIVNTNNSNIALWSDYGEEVFLGTKESRAENARIEPIITLGWSNGSMGVTYIKDTINGTFYVGNTSFSYTNGLITKINTNASGISTTVRLGNYTCTFKNGCLTSAS